MLRTSSPLIGALGVTTTNRHFVAKLLSTITALFIAGLELAFAAVGSSFAAAVPALKLPILAGFVLTLGVVFVAAARISTLLASRRKGLSPPDQLDGLSYHELRAVLAMAGRTYLGVGALGLTALVIVIILVGPISWSTSEPFTQAIAVGVALYTASLSAIFIPLLAGLARQRTCMPTQERNQRDA